MKACPKCGSSLMQTEQKLDGRSSCLGCGYKGLSSEFNLKNQKNKVLVKIMKKKLKSTEPLQ